MRRILKKTGSICLHCDWNLTSKERNRNVDVSSSSENNFFTISPTL